MESTYQDQVRILKAFCDETRLRVLEQLRSGEKCACDLLEKIDCGQSGLSYHMKILVESGVVESRQDGKWTHYKISEQGSAAAVALIKELTAPATILQKITCCGN